MNDQAETVSEAIEKGDSAPPDGRVWRRI